MTLTQVGLSWEEVGEILRPGNDSVAERRDLSGHDPKVLTTFATSFLEPSDHPGSLGRFARYEIMELLGRGGMGIVMRGFDPSLNRHSAIKVLAPELATSAAARKRFSREAKSAAAVVHPHVVPIQTVDEYNGLPYLVMPVVEGQSLQQRVEQHGPLQIIETVRIAAQVAEGLQAAHAQGLVHRDIKPANVLLENGVERVQITDFGLARAIDDASMTRSGVIAGTPQYMSPEQAHGDTIDHRSDLFSLGSVLYFMLAGRSPFRAETTMGVLNRIGNDEPRSIRSINADVPEWLELIVQKLLSKSPDDRFQTAAEVAKLLHDWHAHLQQPDAVAAPTWDISTTKSIAFGKLKHVTSQYTSSNSVSEDPERPSQGHRPLPTLGKGVDAVGYRLRAAVRRETVQPSGKSVIWSWGSDMSNSEVFIDTSGAAPIRSRKERSTRGMGDGRALKLSEGADQLGFEELTLGDRSKLPYSMLVPAGDVTIHLDRIYGHPTVEIMNAMGESISRPDQSEIWLPTMLQLKSQWIARLIDPQGWTYNDRDSSSQSLLSQELQVQAGETAHIMIQSPHKQGAGSTP